LLLSLVRNSSLRFDRGNAFLLSTGALTLFENNRELLDAFRRGTQEALAEVYHCFVEDVDTLVRRGFALGAGRETRVPGAPSPDQERELVQEVFVRAFSEKARMAFDGLRPYRPYLMQITRNLLVDFWRKHGREIQAPESETGVEEIAELEPIEPEENLHRQTLQRATRDYLASLEPRLQEFVKLRFEEEKSQYDLMKEMKITRWNVRSMEKKVQTGLLKYLKKKGLEA
jgi:RNA polymerase sigma factor (sigma-70 family)